MSRVNQKNENPCLAWARVVGTRFGKCKIPSFNSGAHMPLHTVEGSNHVFFSRPHGTFAMHGFIPCSKFERWEACKSFRSLKRQLSYNQTSQIHCCDISNAELPIDILQNCACYHAPFVWPVSVNHSSFAVISLRSDLRMFLGKSNHRSAKYGISSSTMY